MSKPRCLQITLGSCYFGTVNNDMINSYNGWSWNTNDIEQCRNAFWGLLKEGNDESILMELDFGDLDISSVIDEYYDYR